MSHHQKANVSHTEAALSAGRSYEKHKDHGIMYDTYQELQEANKKFHGHANGESRGARIDHELATEDQATIEKMNKSHGKKKPERRYGF
ncbi:hypothetical protein BY458DRAFT_474797 [Sporodiniella umbellata]|nr:hypothetical protein BY458DRAFT_474797 [Sporodiniella umbellata]